MFCRTRSSRSKRAGSRSSLRSTACPRCSGPGESAESGGLMSYGQNIAEHYYRVATYVDKILKGANPGDIPVEQPTKFELVINMKTAKALGLTMQDLLFRADKVIE